MNFARVTNRLNPSRISETRPSWKTQALWCIKVIVQPFKVIGYFCGLFTLGVMALLICMVLSQDVSTLYSAQFVWEFLTKTDTLVTQATQISAGHTVSMLFWLLYLAAIAMLVVTSAIEYFLRDIDPH